eukprot:m.164030 g.164030  ORF g.164030 m.164030 type:complete len:122 (+) comp15225_c1_seq1:67-432(+)
MRHTKCAEDIASNMADTPDFNATATRESLGTTGSTDDYFDNRDESRGDTPPDIGGNYSESESYNSHSSEPSPMREVAGSDGREHQKEGQVVTMLTYKVDIIRMTLKDPFELKNGQKQTCIV